MTQNPQAALDFLQNIPLSNDSPTAVKFVNRKLRKDLSSSTPGIATSPSTTITTTTTTTTTTAPITAINTPCSSIEASPIPRYPTIQNSPKSALGIRTLNSPEKKLTKVTKAKSYEVQEISPRPGVHITTSLDHNAKATPPLHSPNSHNQKLHPTDPSLELFENPVLLYPTPTSTCPYMLFSRINFQKKSKNDKPRNFTPIIDIPSTPESSTPLSHSFEDDMKREYTGNLSSSFSELPPYNPNILDDPTFYAPKDRTVILIPSLRESIIPFVRSKNKSKNEMNEKFHQKHPELPSNLTLSKIRKLKSMLLEIAIDMDVDISSVALAYVCLEKLILKSLIDKENRRRSACVCLLLSIKFYFCIATKQFLRNLIEHMEKTASISTKEILHEEIIVYRNLNYELFVDDSEVLPHYNRIQKILDLKRSNSKNKDKTKFLYYSSLPITNEVVVPLE